MRQIWSAIRERRRALQIALAAAIVFAAFAFYASYEMTHDLPNGMWASWGDGYSYTAGGSLPGAGLLEIRPETLVKQYFHDYIAVAGTFPCAENLDEYAANRHYDWHDTDPVLDKKPCTVSRPVAGVSFGTVTIEPFGDEQEQKDSSQARWVNASVSYQISYADGRRWSSILDFMTDPTSGHIYQRVPFQTGFVIHISCWLSLDVSRFYAIYSLPKPKGVADQLMNWGAPVVCSSC
jgi:hypothetical protein